MTGPDKSAIGVRPMRWQRFRLELIDQRELPLDVQWISIETPAQAAEAIQTMVVRGAPAIGVTAAYGLATLQDEASNNTVWTAACDRLAASRPTAVNLFWAIERMTQRREQILAADGDLANGLAEEAEAMDAEDTQMNFAIGRNGAAAIEGTDRTVLTHCNAGALATSGWGTALGVIRELHTQGRLASVLATETRPYWQGARLTTWELLQDDVPVTLLPDPAAGAAIKQGKVSAVVVGADRIAADGSAANKIGTYTLAVLARQHGIPFYVAAPVSTVDLECATGDDIPIEIRSADEVLQFRGQAVAPAGTDVWNPAFDVTPPDLITEIILDSGRIKPPFGPGLSAAVTESSTR